MSWYDCFFPDCQACQQKSWNLLCELCFKQYRFRGLCAYCADLGSLGFTSCVSCRSRTRSIGALWVSFFYEKEVAKWIRRLKSKSIYRPWRELKKMYLPSELAAAKFDAIAYVPSSRGRQTSPSRELALHLSRIFDNKPVLDLFHRKKFLKDQHQMNSRDRKLMISKIFSLKQTPRPNRLLLVDDVMTTGASLFACANLIKSESPQCQIEAFVVARQKKLL